MSTTSGRSRADQVQRGGAVVGLAHDREVLLGVEEHAEAGADQGLVVGEHDPDHDRPSHVARTRNPPPGRGPASSRPPVDSARSRMPRSPRPLPFDGPTAPAPSSRDLDRQASIGHDAHGGTRAWAAWAWRTTFVRDSCTMR